MGVTLGILMLISWQVLGGEWLGVGNLMLISGGFEGM